MLSIVSLRSFLFCISLDFVSFLKFRKSFNRSLWFLSALPKVILPEKYFFKKIFLFHITRNYIHIYLFCELNLLFLLLFHFFNFFYFIFLTSSLNWYSGIALITNCWVSGFKTSEASICFLFWFLIVFVYLSKTFPKRTTISKLSWFYHSTLIRR